MKTLKESVIEQIENMSSSDLINLNNAYSREAGYSDGEIFDNDQDFFNVFFEGKVLEAVRAVSFGQYNYTDDFVKFNGYGNLESLNYLELNNLVENVEVIAEYAIENQREFDMLDFEFDEEENEEDEVNTNTHDEALDFLVKEYGLYSNPVDVFMKLGKTQEAINYAMNHGYNNEDEEI